MSFDDHYNYPVGRTVNIASGNAVVGQQIGGPAGVECFAWIRDDEGELWVLVGRHADGGLYNRADRAAGRSLGVSIDRVVRWTPLATGPVVWMT